MIKHPVLALLLLAALAASAITPAYAEPVPAMTPAEFVEWIKTMVGVEQDPAEAKSSAERMGKLHKHDHAWAAALLELAEWAEKSGHPQSALDFLRTATVWHTHHLTADERRVVRASVKRLLPAGERAPVPGERGIETFETPLARDAGSGASPLEEKVRELFAPLAAVTDRKEQSSVRSSITSALIDTGPEILGVLARIASDTPGAVGRLAGELLARRGGDAARPYLMRMLDSGNTLTRGTALRSLSDLPRPETGTWWQAHGDFIERVRKDASASEKALIRYSVLLQRMTDDELWGRYQQGGEDAHHFLSRLGRSGDVRAFREAIAALASDEVSEVERAAHRDILLRARPNQRGRVLGLLLADVDERQIRAAVELYWSQRWSGLGGRHSALWALKQWRGDEDARKAIANEVWIKALKEMSNPETERNHVNHIASMLRGFADSGYMPPPGFCEDAALCRTFFANLHMSLHGTQIRPLFDAQPVLFERMFDVLPRLDQQERKHLLGQVLERQLPSSLRWGEVLELSQFAKPSGRDGLLPSIIIEMARADDPALWPWIARHIEETGYPEDMQKVIRALSHHPNEQVLAFAKRALDRAKGMDTTVLSHIINLLDYRYLDVEEESPYGAQAIEILNSIAADPAHAASVLALRKLIGLQQDARLVPLFAQALDMPRPLPEGWREALIRAADERLLVEGAPFLIEQYREKREERVAKVLDKLRAHRERLASFENWRADEGREAVTALLAQLDSQDVAERRIAVLALAAMREQRAIPKLAKLALKDPDTVVRNKASAALEALAGLPK